MTFSKFLRRFTLINFTKPKLESKVALHHRKMSEATRRKISKANKGRKMSKETRAKISASLKARHKKA